MPIKFIEEKQLFNLFFLFFQFYFLIILKIIKYYNLKYIFNIFLQKNN